MDEKKIQQARRDNDEQATQKRASILGMQYLDTREIESTLPLVTDSDISIKEMHLNKMIPLMAGSASAPARYGVSDQTPQSVIKKM